MSQTVFTPEQIAMIREIVNEMLMVRISDDLIGRVVILPKAEGRPRRSQEEVMDSISRNRWTPPPGSRSTLELLREDRDR